MTATIKTWTDGVLFEDSAREQLENTATLPFIYPHIAVMPDVHTGIGSTVGSVIPTRGAVIPAAVGVDIGCGMIACKTTLVASDLPDNLHNIRLNIEGRVPVGNASNIVVSADDGIAWADLVVAFCRIRDKYPIDEKNAALQLSTLGSGNHFIELCLDEDQHVWIMLHTGSRGIGNRIGTYFIELAKKDMRRWFINIPDTDLAYIPEASAVFDDYMDAITWAQSYASYNRSGILTRVIDAMRASNLPEFGIDGVIIDCHHNYIAHENHYGRNVYVTRKGALRARAGDMGIIPGSMGAKSYIVRGKGNAESLNSCSHGAGRVLSRKKAKEKFSLSDHIASTQGVECRKDASVIDETPGAYKDIDAVMEAQKDLVDIVHTLKQVLCVKG